MLKNRVSRVIKQSQNEVVLVIIRKEKKKKKGSHYESNLGRLVGICVSLLRGYLELFVMICTIRFMKKTYPSAYKNIGIGLSP